MSLNFQISRKTDIVFLKRDQNFTYFINRSAVGHLAQQLQNNQERKIFMAYQFDPNDETTNVSDHIILVENETIRKRIGDLGMKILQIMAYEGISEEKELVLAVSDVILLSTGQLVSNDSIRRSVQTLSFNLLIEIEEVNTGIRRFNVLKLTENGRKFMGHNFRKKRVESECERFKREHANIHHGYLIKEVKKVLEDKEIYDEISTGRDENFIRIGDGRACIPDVICKSGDKRFFYEVECGTHKQLDFNEKCNKLSMLTREIIIVGQNRQIVGGNLKRQVENWIDKEWESLIKWDVEVYLTTITDLKNDKWTYCYGLETSEPQCNCPIVWEKEGR